MVQVKICGIRRAEDAEAAVQAGANALGFNFWKGTPRYISPREAARILSTVSRGIWTVAVFVDETPERVLEIAVETGVSVLQFHGSESPEYLDRLESYLKIKAVKVGNDFHPEQISRYRSASAFLLDGFVAGMHGGTGKTFDWSQAQKAKAFGRIILAGGLKASNVGEAVRQVCPWGVDVCSGVEAEPGKKDPQRIRQFVESVRAAELQAAGNEMGPMDRASENWL